MSNPEQNRLFPTDATGQQREMVIAQFPEHLQESVRASVNNLSGPAAPEFLPPDSTKAIELASGVTGEELETLYRLHLEEQQLTAKLDNLVRTELEAHPVPDFFREAKTRALRTVFARNQYDRIRSGVKPVEERAREALALSFAMTRYAFADANGNFTLRETQRLACLRIVRGALNENTNGLVIDMDMGDGKSSAVIPTVLPALLLLKPNWAVTALKPATRDRGALRFRKLARMLGIGVNVFSDRSHRYEGDFTTYLMGNGQAKALNGVVYLLKTDLGHFLEREMPKENPAVTPDPARWGAVMDEVDAEKIEESLLPMVISGPEISLPKWLSDNWPLFGETTKSESRWEEKVRLMLTPFVEKAKSRLPETACLGPGYEDAGLSLGMLLWVFDRLGDLRTIQDAQRSNDYFDQANRLTVNAWYELARMLKAESLGKPRDPNRLVPPKWLKFTNKLLPPYVTNAIETAWSDLESGKSYITSEDHAVVPLNERTGWPHPNREYEPLVLLAVIARNLHDKPDAKFPAAVHGYTDSLSTLELVRLFFGTTIGLTGTGTDSRAVAWFRKYLNLEVTAIPSGHPDNHFREEIVLLPDAQAKMARLTGTLKDIEGPVLINLPDIQTANRVAETLRRNFPGKKVQLLTAETILNQPETIAPITMSAGKDGSVTLTVRLGVRELDIIPENTPLLAINWESSQNRSDDIQFARRAFRAGHQGRAIRLISPQDPLIIKAGKEELMTLLVKTKAVPLAQFVTSGIQEKNSRKLINTLETEYRRLAPLAEIRAHVFKTDGKTRQAIGKHWRDFLTICQTRYLEYASGWRGQGPAEARIRQYEVFVYSLYADLLTAAAAGERELTQVIQKAAGENPARQA